MPLPFTKPACMMAETGVGEFNELINQRLNGHMPDWVMAPINISIKAIIVEIDSRF